MLAQTMDKLQRNASRTPRKVKSNTIAAQNIQIQKQPSRADLGTGYYPSSSTNNLPAQINTINIPIKRDVLQGNFDKATIIHQPNSIHNDYQRQNLKSLNNNLLKTKSQIFNIPLLKQSDTQQSWQSKLSSTQNQQFLINSERRIVCPLDIPHSSTERPTLSLRNNDIEINHYQRQINSLKQQLSQSFSDKLSLELKLNKTIQVNKQLVMKVNVLTKQLELETPLKQKNSHSTTLSHQNDTIIQLLSQYQDTKKIIQKLMQDNQNLIKKNEQLSVNQMKVNKLKNQLEKFKIIVVKIENEKFSLIEQIQTLSSDLDKQRKDKYWLIKQVENKSKNSQQAEAKEVQITNSKQQIEALKSHIIKTNNDKITQDFKAKNQMQSQIEEMIKQIQQYAVILSNKDQQIINLNQQLKQMTIKLKEVLGELMTFSQAFQLEKTQLNQQFQAYKISTSEQINRLKREVSKQIVREPTSPGSHTVYIEATDLKETKTRITGRILTSHFGSEPTIPVVASVRSVSNLDPPLDS